MSSLSSFASSFREGLKSKDFVFTRAGPRLLTPAILLEDVGVGVRDFFSRSRDRSRLRFLSLSLSRSRSFSLLSRSRSLLFFDLEDEDEEVELDGDKEPASGELAAVVEFYKKES